MLKILIVDDTKSVHAFVKSLLNKSPEISTIDVYNGDEALARCKTERFDLILLDWEMPVRAGPETFQGFKEMGLGTPVIMMTTKNAHEDIALMLNLGVAEYLIKPFTVDIIFEKIESVLRRAVPYAA